MIHHPSIGWKLNQAKGEAGGGLRGGGGGGGWGAAADAVAGLTWGNTGARTLWLQLITQWGHRGKLYNFCVFQYFRNQ